MKLVVASEGSEGNGEEFCCFLVEQLEDVDSFVEIKDEDDVGDHGDILWKYFFVFEMSDGGEGGLL